jgi:hypothetical protein
VKLKFHCRCNVCAAALTYFQTLDVDEKFFFLNIFVKNKYKEKCLKLKFFGQCSLAFMSSSSRNIINFSFDPASVRLGFQHTFSHAANRVCQLELESLTNADRGTAVMSHKQPAISRAEQHQANLV